MRLTEHLYKTSGVERGTNSNTFVIDTEEGIILLDLGYKEFQWNQMELTLKEWGLSDKKRICAFLTHGHYDHAGNVHRANALHIPVIVADPDASKIETGYPEMERLFGAPWITGHVDKRPLDGEIYQFGRVTIEAVAAPGHSKGSFAYVITVDGIRALLTGDMFFIKPQPPIDAVDIELAYMGGEDFSLSDFKNTLAKMGELHCSLLLPGHYYPWFGDVDTLCHKAYLIASVL